MGINTYPNLVTPGFLTSRKEFSDAIYPYHPAVIDAAQADLTNESPVTAAVAKILVTNLAGYPNAVFCVKTTTGTPSHVLKALYWNYLTQEWYRGFTSSVYAVAQHIIVVPTLGMPFALMVESLNTGEELTIPTVHGIS